MFGFLTCPAIRASGSSLLMSMKGARSVGVLAVVGLGVVCLVDTVT